MIRSGRSPRKNQHHLVVCYRCSHLVLIAFRHLFVCTLCQKSTMKRSDIRGIGDGVFELEKGHGDQKPDNGDIVKLLFGGIQTAFTSKYFEEDDVR